MRQVISFAILSLLMPVTFGQYKTAVFEQKDRAEKVRNISAVISKMYEDYAKKNHFPGMVYGVVVDGELIVKGTYGILNTETNTKVSTTSLFRIASMTKSFTAMAIMKLQDEGKLNVRDEASKYIPEISRWTYLTADARPITIHNLLTMTAGFPEDNPWGDRQLEDSDREFLDFLKGGVSFSTNPGEAFEYSNLGYAMLGNIVTRVSGMPYQDYISKNILMPLGMKDTYWEYTKIKKEVLALGYRWEDEKWKEEPMLHDGAYGAMGGLITSLEDFSKYVALHLSAYPSRNDPDNGPVKRSSIKEMHKPYMPQLFADAKRGDGTPCPIFSGYAYGLGNRQDCKGVVRISHSGGLPGFGSEYRFFPDYGFGVICFANRTYAGAGAINGRVADTLMTLCDVKKRVLPPSDKLVKMKDAIVALLPDWSEAKTANLFAENFFLDESIERRRKAWKELFDRIGKFVSVEPLVPENQLRGTFVINGDKGNATVFFTMSPEKDSKIQHLSFVK